MSTVSADHPGGRWSVRGTAAVTAGQRVARLLLMIGLAVAAYGVLSLLDHAARADEGLTDRLGSVEKVAAEAKKIPADAQRTADPVKAKTPKVLARKIEVRKIEVRKIEVRRIEVRKVVTSVVKKRPVPAVTTRVTTAIKTEVRRVSTTPAAARRAVVRPAAPAGTARSAAPDVTEHRSTSTSAGPAVAKSPSPPASPQRDSQGAGTTHLRDCGGGSAPPMGTVPSSWWPELTATVVPSPAAANTPGRTVRYCGPPS
jgi:hypothetical protein